MMILEEMSQMESVMDSQIGSQLSGINQGEETKYKCIVANDEPMQLMAIAY